MTSFFTKKDLETRFNIADTTVYRTLKACGLSTAKRRYTEEEISHRFIPARRLFKAGYTTQQVTEYFQLRNVSYDHQKRTIRTIQPECENSQ